MASRRILGSPKVAYLRYTETWLSLCVSESALCETPAQQKGHFADGAPAVDHEVFGAFDDLSKDRNVGVCGVVRGECLVHAQ